MSKVEAADEKATFIMAQQALKDCNKYCKKDQSGLINSSLIHTCMESSMTSMDAETKKVVSKSPGSDLPKGRLIWKTPYARKQYYLDAANKTLNKNARKMWAHYAAKKHKKDWKAVYEAMLKKEMHDDQ